MGLYVAIIWTALSLLVAATLGRWVFISACLGLALAWPIARRVQVEAQRLLGNAACGFSYEGSLG